MNKLNTMDPRIKYATAEEAAEANRLRSKEYYWKHKENKSDYYRQYYLKNREKRLQYTKEWKKQKQLEKAQSSQVIQQYLTMSMCPCQQHLVLENPMCNYLQLYLSQQFPSQSSSPPIQIEIINTKSDVNLNYSQIEQLLNNGVIVNPNV